ncbi:hypothetical protein [Actinoplanes sp. HUAS TT8]|uniref:hypothetical protein n=1 Tax=Actinoplanes sp. HUAS TT8 TaxID=3447453 RepID=UPI003F51D8C2
MNVYGEAKMSGEPNPYSDATKANTNAPWLSETTPIDVDLDGLREYASLMAKQQLDLAGEQTHLMHLYDTPFEAWKDQVLGEAATIRAQLKNNATELSSYLGYLGQTFFNIGSAAQTIADIYQSGDATGAADLNDVLFAFGDKSVGRPDGLPKGIGQTYWEALAAQGGNEQTGAPAANSAEWQPPVTTSISPYQLQENSTGPNGQRMEKIITTVPGSGVMIETVTIFNAKGDVLSTKSTRTTTSYDTTRHTLTTTTENSQGGKATGSSTTTTTYDGSRVVDEKTVSKSASGQETSTTHTQTDAKGETVETTDKPARDEHGKLIPGQRTTTDSVTTGAATDDSGTTSPTSLADEADPIARKALG